jgi:antirestriction protein ArdC
MTTPTEAPAAWSALLADAVSKPGLISEAYSKFWGYSFGNQLLALWQCMLRDIEPGPINTFLRWQSLGRNVKKGEKALTLCMPVTIKARKNDVPDEGEEEPVPTGKRTIFVWKNRWFVLSQTEGEPYQPQELPSWSEERALATLSISRIPFTHLDGNAQGFARDRSVSISPIAFAPHRTLFHELAHVILGHTGESAMTDDDCTPRNIREVEAEGAALICCECLGLPGVEYSRGYLQHWLRADQIPDRSAQRIFKAADTILRAGRPAESPSDFES